AGISDFFKNRALAYVDILAPNLLELGLLTGRDIRNVPEALVACRQLREQGVKQVLVKHLGKAGFAVDRFEMLLVCEEGAYHISRPLYPFSRDPIGVGDLLSAMMLANLLAGFDPVRAFERTNASVNAVLAQTWITGHDELQLVAAQHDLAQPQVSIRANRV
ncbi:MAG: PfkB family carbohydrate kinase, partial [Aeromonas sp.]